MFSSLHPIVDWIFSELSKFVSFLWSDCKWVGVCVVGLPLLRKVVDIFRKLF